MATRRIVVTGIGGAVGAELATRLVPLAAEFEIIGVFRGARSRDAFLARAPEDVREAVRPLVCDLTDPAQVGAVAGSLPPAQSAVVVHAAANVSWTLSRDEAWRTNVEATRNAAELARRVAARSRLLYVSSAFTATQGWTYRNTYEESKAAAERMVRAQYPDLRPVVFSCSLVVGSSTTGAISRFHGIYPLLRLVERAEPPFLPGTRDLRIDIVPVDWVADELAGLISRTMPESAIDDVIPDVVASAGGAAPLLPDLVALVVAALNRHRLAAGRLPLADIPVVPFRRWDFLRRSIDAWQVSAIKLPNRGELDLLLEVYRPYFSDDRGLAPGHVSRPAPAAPPELHAGVWDWRAR